MADISDVEKAISRHLRATFFPGMTTKSDTLTPSPVVKVDGQPVKLRIRRGWPVDGALDKDMADGGCVITIYTEPGMTRNTNRFRPQALRPIHKVPITIGATREGAVVTFTGAPTAGQYVGIGIGQVGYTHVCQDGEALGAVVADLADQIDGASAAGAVLTLPTDQDIVVMCESETTLTRRVGTQIQAFAICIWAADEKIRDAVGKALVPAMTMVRTIALNDGTKTTPPRLIGTWTDDFTQKAKVWRRWHRIELEYSTTETVVAPPVLHLGVNTGEHQVGRFPPEGPIE